MENKTDQHVKGGRIFYDNSDCIIGVCRDENADNITVKVINTRLIKLSECNEKKSKSK